MKIVSTIDGLLEYRNKLNNKSIGLVPTMGALHGGHLSLVELSKNLCDITIVTIFLNSKQFSANEDLSTYPVNNDKDANLLKKLNVDVLFMPSDSIMYPIGFSTYVVEKKISLLCEGKSRPMFFQGVLTIVSKLFNIIRPSHAFFGQKDAQQLFLIKKMVKDMNYNITVIDGPTIRQDNGLAMSSRNKYFTIKQIDESKIIYKSLGSALSLIKNGQLSCKAIKDNIEYNLTHPHLVVDYISIVDENSFMEIKQAKGNVIILIAVMFYDVRLIDNIYYSSSTI